MAGGPPGEKKPGYESVGVTPAFAATSMKERPYAVWVPFSKDSPEATVVVRTSQSPQKVLPAIRRTMSEIDHNLPMVDEVTMQEQIAIVQQLPPGLHERGFVRTEQHAFVDHQPAASAELEAIDHVLEDKHLGGAGLVGEAGPGVLAILAA